MFKEGDEVFSKQYNEFGTIKKIYGGKCSVVFPKIVLGSTVKITELALLVKADKRIKRSDKNVG